ncbi:MAG TPA: WecB/TagA/CpsF family glycosyltransferase [Candidatus Kapabacteria bacterium]|nr:WecB/TagA/CpsF family glycosyltransferase [Candidatus Kapabacteria bacterium]
MDRFKESFPFPAAAPIAILGVPFDNVSTAETLRIIDDMIASKRPHYMVTANVDFLVQAAHDVELRRILFDAHLVLCDGTPLVWASRLLGNPLPERVAGSDLVPLLLKVAAEKGYRPFFLGATPESIKTAVAKAQQQYPKLKIAGYYSPPFNKLLEMDHEEIRDHILRAQPDLLFVGFGCPKQEKWINMHYRSLGVPVSVGVGGTIDFLAGRLARAPRWMQKSGTEWIFRLAQEPKRLLRRYAKDLWHFTGALAAQYWRLRRRPRNKEKEVVSIARPPVSMPFQVLQVPPRLDFEEVHRIREEMEAELLSPAPVVLDLKRVEFIDSTGVGLLIRMQKRARSGDRQLILANVPENVHRALELMRLTDFFITAPDLQAAEAHLREAGKYSAVQLRTQSMNPFPALVWKGELTAANAEEIWIATMDHLAARSLVQRTLTIDLSNLHFVDSTGLSVMIRTRKYATRQGIRVNFSGMHPNVLNVVRLSRLEDYLLRNEE